MVFLLGFAFELPIEFNIALAPTSPGTALVSSVTLAVFASSLLKDGARYGFFVALCLLGIDRLAVLLPFVALGTLPFPL